MGLDDWDAVALDGRVFAALCIQLSNVAYRCVRLLPAWWLLPTTFGMLFSLGKHVSRVLILSILACAVLIVLLRVAIVNEEEESSTTTYDVIEDGSSKVQIDIDDGLVLDVESISDFQFVAAYLVEMVLSLFVYYPIGGTILFSGILSCGCKIPLLGGRPYEVALEQRRLARKSRNNSNVGGSKGAGNLRDIESLR